MAYYTGAPTTSTDEDPSFLESAWGLGAGTIISGVKTLGDSLGVIGGKLGITSPYEQTDTRGAIAEYAGEAAAAFYDRNPGLVEGAGLIASSIVPGGFGVKAFGALRASQVARNSTIGGLLRLPHAALEETRDAAVAAMQVSDVVYGSITSKTLKALGAGFAANTLDAAAFEVAAITLTFASPVYSELEGSDYAKWMATNVVAGGVIGGAFSAARTGYLVATSTSSAAKQANALRTFPSVGAESQVPHVNLTSLYSILDPAEQAIKAKQAEALGAAPTLIQATQLKATAAAKGAITKEMARITPDTDVAVTFTNMLASDAAVSDAKYLVTGLTKLSRGHLNKGEMGRTFDTLTNTEYAAGEIPGTHIGDTLSFKHSIGIGGDSIFVKAENGTTNSIKIGANFEQLDEIAAQAAYLKANLSPGAIKLDVAANDLPNLERLLDASQDAFLKKQVKVGGRAVKDFDELQTIIFNEKFRQADILAATMLPEQLATRLNVELAFLRGAEKTNMLARSGDELTNFLRNPRYISATYDVPRLTSATEAFFTNVIKQAGATNATISTGVFLRNAGDKAVPQKIVDRIAAGMLNGKGKVTAPTIVVRKDGTLTFDGVKRLNAVKKLLSENAIYDDVPVRVKVEDGATIPTHLPTGEPFPVVTNADGTIGVNPLADSVDVRLTRSYAESGKRAIILNQQHSAMRELTAASLLPGTVNLTPEKLLLELTNTASSPSDVGQTLTFNAEAATGGLGAATQLIGVQVHTLITAAKEVTERVLNPFLIAAKTEPDMIAAKELMRLDNIIKGVDAPYVLSSRAGQLGVRRLDIAINEIQLIRKAEAEAELKQLIEATTATPAELRRLNNAIREASITHVVNDGSAKAFIPLSKKAYELLEASTGINTRNQAVKAKVAAGLDAASVTKAQQFDLQQIYFPPVDTKMYSHFVFARQVDHITNTSHTSVVTAATADALADKVKLIQRNFPGIEFVGEESKKYSFFYKSDIADFHKAKGDYEYSRGLNDNAIDSALKSLKLMGQPDEVLPLDTEHANLFLDKLLNWHLLEEGKRVRDVVELKYAQAFRQLQLMGDSYAKAGTSQFGGATTSSAAYAASTVKNPYGDMLKQALDIGKQQEYPLLLAANELFNKGYAKAVLNLKKGWLAAVESKTPRDLEREVDVLNKIADSQGFGNPYSAYMLEKWRDQLPANASLVKGIAKSNAVLNFLVLGSDVLQAVNTAVGVTVHATEIAAVRSQILKHDAAAGKLTGLPVEDINLIEIAYRSAAAFSRGDTVLNARGELVKRSGKQLIEDLVRTTGFRSGDAAALHDALDNMALASANASTLGAGADRFMEFGRKWSGNNMADLFSRFLAAHSMRILTDKARIRGLISSEAEAAIYINQHVTRVHGASIASQRPVMFSGPIGQSIGVFMSFYVNFLQRMFQHAGEGNKQALATMASMQVGLYGLQGLPAFNYINTQLVGTASGNKDHTDIYTSVGNSEEAKWLMFGAGSNALGFIHPDLKVNLYSRGDLNPRQASIIPLLPWETPLWTATAKTATNIKKLAQHLSGGSGIAPSLAYALEHNGVNRPLSGLGALWSGGQSTSKGSLLAEYGNDDYSIFAMAARIAGGKPLDDATAADALYRSQAYKADRADRIAKVGENLRVALKNGEEPDTLDFMRSYTRAGGDLDSFNKFMKKQFIAANNSQITKAANDLNSPEAKGLARLLGGDFVTGEED